MPGLEDDLKALDQQIPQGPPQPQQEAPMGQEQQAGGLEQDIQASDANKSGAFMSGVAGFNKGVEDITTGVLQMIPGLRKPVDDYMTAKTKELANISEEHPVAASVGKFLGAMGVTLPAIAIPGGLAAQGAKAGALLGGLSYTDSNGSYTDMITNKVGNAVTGGIAGGIAGGAFQATGAAMKPIAEYAKGVIKGSKYLFKDANKIIDEAISKEVGDTTASQAIAKATYSTVENRFKDFVKGAEADGNKLYAIRDMIANKSNVNTIDRAGLKDLLKNTSDEIASGSTSTTKAIYSELKSIVGSGKPITYQKAQDLVSEIGKKSFAAHSAGDNILASGLIKAKNTLINDIDQSVAKAGVPELSAAHDLAKAYYQNTVAPLQSISAVNHLSDKFTNEKFVASALSRSAASDTRKAAEITKGLSILPDDIKKSFVTSHLQALMAASTKSGVFDIKAYAQKLTNDIRKIPALSNLGIDIMNISHIANATAMAKNAMPGGISSALGGAGIVGAATMGTIGALPAVGMLAWKSKFLYAASRLLENPQTSAMLTTLRNPKLEAPITQHLVKKLASAYVGYQSSKDAPKIKNTNMDNLELETAGVNL